MIVLSVIGPAYCLIFFPLIRGGYHGIRHSHARFFHACISGIHRFCPDARRSVFIALEKEQRGNLFIDGIEHLYACPLIPSGQKLCR